MNCIIIEDEIPAQEILITYIGKIPDLEIKGVFNSALMANKILKEEQIDILFLDINLPNISGMNYLKTLQNPPYVIMTTAYSNYAAESFEFDTIVDYLTKPFSFERFLKAINKVENRQSTIKPIKSDTIQITKNEDSVFINVDKTLHKINLNTILYVQSDRNYVTVVTENISLSFIDSLKKWNDYLIDEQFLQIHKSYIINLNYVEKVTGNLVYINKQKIPVGRTFKDVLFEKIKPIN
ncbi:DNA-binding response regulator [Tenacibaculum sp. Bg11-29]|uniref:LytR/AlgR family response regulator transcription factor n=1 Tax=Tenacibaculum sp. Bg11-29 TaxID=2058306 RepID=UPI000C3396DC|nr:LytTR family DNA-binding domain-containing protein [Tenacibaculum sp. Bg11-29]PKH51783.1 DNA-binding response regulator [Tenacibaculum sp. Bg11-29]